MASLAASMHEEGREKWKWKNERKVRKMQHWKLQLQLRTVGNPPAKENQHKPLGGDQGNAKMSVKHGTCWKAKKRNEEMRPDSVNKRGAKHDSGKGSPTEDGGRGGWRDLGPPAVI